VDFVDVDVLSISRTVDVDGVNMLECGNVSMAFQLADYYIIATIRQRIIWTSMIGILLFSNLLATMVLRNTNHASMLDLLPSNLFVGNNDLISRPVPPFPPTERGPPVAL
jgi:hypothetical protein